MREFNALDLFLTKNLASREDVMSLCEIDEETFELWRRDGIPYPFDKLIEIACGGDIGHIRGFEGWRIFPHKLETPAGWIVYSNEIEDWVVRHGSPRNTCDPNERTRRNKFRRHNERAAFIRQKTTRRI